MAVREPATTCTIHGRLETAWCTQCDATAGVERHPITGRETTAAERQQAMVDALAAAGLSDSQIKLVLSTLETGPTGAVSDEQLHRVLESFAGRAQPAVNTASGSESDVIAGLREAGWSDERIAGAVGHPV